MKSFAILLTTSLAAVLSAHALPPSVAAIAEKSALSSFVIQAKRVVWTSETGVANAANLLKPKSGQAVLKEPEPTLIMQPGSSIVLDFGVEIQGSIELFTPMTKSKHMPSVRIRFGESVAETMVELDERGAQNDQVQAHALGPHSLR